MSEQKRTKSYEELEYRDDFMFGKVMEDPELCHDVLECLLQRNVGQLKDVETQKEFRFTSDGKPIRLDVYNQDSNSEIYDAEMQNLNKKSIESLALPKRSRFYQASIDIDYMDKGNSFKTLPASNILFICTFDPFGMGLSQYTFRERCDEDQEFILGDETEKHFYNCTYSGGDIPDDLKEFYEYVQNGKPKSELTKRIDEAVVRGRKNSEWRTQYMKERLYIQDIVEDIVEEKEAALKRADEALKRAEIAEQRLRELEEAEKRLKELKAAQKRIKELEAELAAIKQG